MVDKQIESIKLCNLQKRADVVWGEKTFDLSDVSELLGSSNADNRGQDYWKFVNRSSFLAPNFYLERDTPILIKALDCIKLGSDRDERPLYYFLSNGKYAVSSDIGLLFVSDSTEQFFDVFITYAEWIEEILITHGPHAFNNSQFSIDDLERLRLRFNALFKDTFIDSFWDKEIGRLSTGIQEKTSRTD